MIDALCVDGRNAHVADVHSVKRDNARHEEIKIAARRQVDIFA